MYTIGYIKPAGIGWWEGRLYGPRDVSIAIKMTHPGMTVEEAWTRMQDKCDDWNVANGFVKVKRAWGPTDPYRRRNILDYEARSKLRKGSTTEKKMDD